MITGINSGTNLGQDFLFSGIFGAALTAQLFGIPAIATSLVGGGVKCGGQEQASHYQMAADEIVKLLVDTPILDICKNLPYHVLNVNIPDVGSADDIKGRKITSLGHSQIARPLTIWSTHVDETLIGYLYVNVRMSSQQKLKTFSYLQ